MMPRLEVSCPLPSQSSQVVSLAAGSGGRETWRLLNEVFFPIFSDPRARDRHDGTIFPVAAGNLAMTTDSFVVQPLFFPGGDIGTLAVFGTVNDLAMCGARPTALSLGFILEEDFSLPLLRKIVESIGLAAAHAKVGILAGDTKVVEKGKGDGIYINSTGIGIGPTQGKISPVSIQPGDAILLSGDLGRHAIAILAAREELALECELESDCCCLLDPVMALLDEGIEIHCLRDLTRGGLAAALNEIALTRGLPIRIEEGAIPTNPLVQSACEILGFDSLHLANEGRFVCILPPDQATKAVSILHRFPNTQDVRLIGTVSTSCPRVGVEMATILGTRRLLEMPSGVLLPRIC